MDRAAADKDEQFDRKFGKDTRDNWAGILTDHIHSSAGGFRAEARRLARSQPEFKACLTDVDLLVKQIQRDSRKLKRILLEHGLIPVFSSRRT